MVAGRGNLAPILESGRNKLVRTDWIALDICYPDGLMKSAGWGGMWITNTDALVFSELVMTEQQRRMFGGGRRLRGPAWRNRPTLIRKTRYRTEEPICSASRSQSDDNNRTCERLESDRDRGVVREITLTISADGKRFSAVIDQGLMSNTSELVLNKSAMTEDEKKSVSDQRTAMGVALLR